MVPLTQKQKPRFQSFEEYLAYDDGSDRLYELFNGELLELPVKPGLNIEIATLLLMQFLPIVGHRRIRGHGLELEVQGEPKNRYPDLTLIREEHIEQLKKRNTIRLSMAPPVLVMEVVSPGAVQRDRDYIAKRHQYEDLGIPEYWIINPEDKTILVLVLDNDSYQGAATFKGQDSLFSPQLGNLPIKADDVFGVETNS